MGLGKACEVPTEGTGCRLAFSYCVAGDLRYLSHRDTLRMFRRALARGRFALRFTEGFNPRPRMSIALPRPVGIASETESLLVELTEAIDPDKARERLTQQVPPEITINGARMLEPGSRPVPVEARYRLTVGANPPPDLQASIDRLLGADVAYVSRFSPKLGRTRQIDVRPYVMSVRLAGEAVEFTLRLTQSGGAKPAEIAGRLGYDPGTINHQICRMEVRWQ